MLAEVEATMIEIKEEVISRAEVFREIAGWVRNSVVEKRLWATLCLPLDRGDYKNAATLIPVVSL